MKYLYFVRQQIDRGPQSQSPYSDHEYTNTGRVTIAAIRELSAELAREEEIKTGLQYFSNVVEAEKEAAAAAFMASGSEDEAGDEEGDPVPMLEDEFFRPEDLPRNLQNRQNYPNFTLMALDGGVADRKAARMATGETKTALVVININLFTQNLFFMALLELSQSRSLNYFFLILMNSILQDC